MFSLKSIEEEDKAKAFEKVPLNSSVEEGKLGRITEEYYNDALAVLRYHFSTDEPLLRGAGMKWGSDAEEVWLNILRMNLSLMIKNIKTEEIMAVLAIQIVGPESKFITDGIEDKGMQVVWKFMGLCDKRAHVLEHFVVEEAVHLLGLVVVPKERKKGIGSAIVQAAIEMVKKLGVKPVCIKAECSSNFSQKIFEKVEFHMILEIPFDEYQLNGEPVFKNTGEHKTIRMYGMLLNA